MSLIAFERSFFTSNGRRNSRNSRNFTFTSEVIWTAKSARGFARWLTLTHDALSRLSGRPLPHNALAQVHARKPFRMRTSEKRLRKSFAMRTCKIIGLKPAWNEQLQKYRGVSPSLPSRKQGGRETKRKGDKERLTVS